MKVGTKIAVTGLTLLLFMTVLPLLAIKLLPPWGGMGLWIFSFFAVNPLLVIGLSIMAGTDLRKLCWVPLGIAILFPLLFGIAIGEFVWDLYVYSAIYFPTGVLAMLGTHFGKKIASKRKQKAQ